MNIYDISKECGVSIATVSRVINNSGYVSEKTRKKVMAVIEACDYSPNAFARGMSRSSMSTAGILCSDSRDPYQAECIYWLQKELSDAGYTAMLCCTGPDLESRRGYTQLLLSRNVDALICIGSSFAFDDPAERDIILSAARKVPVFLLNGQVEHENIYSILCDDKDGMKELTELVLKNGSTNPIMLIDRNTPSTLRKIDGYLDALQAAQFERDPERAFMVDHDPAKLEAQIEKLILEEHHDALLCCDDRLAMEALKTAEKNGIRVPEDLQITGYNGSALAKMSWPEITTYDNRVPYLCSQTLSALKNVLANREFPGRMVYSGRLVPAGTTRNQ